MPNEAISPPAHGKVRLDADSLATVREHLGDLREPLARSLVWAALWNATRDALLPWLPIRSQLIHCKWSGESTWIPFGDQRPDVGYENHTAHPAPGQILIYTGEISECEILFPYGACSFSSRVGPLAGNHFATLTSGQEQLAEMGRRVLWEGAQEIEINEA